MEPRPAHTFAGFRLEPPPGGLWRGDVRLALRPRSLAMLRSLLAHAGRLVTKAELRQHVWGGTHVTDTVLRVSVQEIRAALGDTAAAPQYLETVAQQGYRLRVGGVTEDRPPRTAGPIVGRQQAVARLEDWFQRAAQGTRQLVFVSGDVGMGKTTVVDRFLAPCAAGSAGRIGRGQCAEHYGEEEPYLPVFEALWQLSRGPARDEVLAGLRRYAPLWLVQLPGLVSEPELERLQRQVARATPTRMRRELAQALDVLTADTPLVLVLEDLQWSDPSTVDLLAALAQRREPAQLLVLGTYRPVDLVLHAHPLRGLVQELRGRGLVHDLPLELLPAADVAAYLAGRLGGPVASPLVALVYALGEAATDGWGSARVIGALVLSALLLSGFIFWQSKIPNPLLPLRVLKERNRAGSFLTILLAVAGMFGTFLFLTYLLQSVDGYSPLKTGVAFLPLLVMNALASTQLASRLLPRVATRLLVVPGLVVAALGVALLTQLSPDSSYVTHLLPTELLLGLGLGLAIVPCISTATNHAAPHDVGVTAATTNTSQQIGASIGTALLNTIAASATATYLRAHRGGTELLQRATVHGYALASAWAAGILLLAAVLSGILITAHPRRDAARKVAVTTSEPVPSN